MLPQIADLRIDNKTPEEMIPLLVKQLNTLSQQVQLALMSIDPESITLDSGESLTLSLEDFYTKAATNGLLSGKSDTGHVHDDRYYTESEVNTLLGGKSNTTHDHDDRYYTDSEVNTLLSGKAATSHAHDSGSALPTASVLYRGRLFVLLGGTGVSDIQYVCIKNAADTYEWVTT